MDGDRITTDEEGNLVIQTGLIGKLDLIAKDQAAGFARLEKAMEGKADRADLAKIEGRMEEHGRQLADLQTWRHDKEVAIGVHGERDAQVFTKRQKFWGTIGALALVAATILGPMIANLVH